MLGLGSRWFEKGWFGFFWFAFDERYPGDTMYIDCIDEKNNFNIRKIHLTRNSLGMTFFVI